MKKILLTVPSKLFRFYSRALVVLLFSVGIFNVSNAQCSGPYQKYESVASTLGGMTGWAFTGGFSIFNQPNVLGVQPRTGYYALRQNVNSAASHTATTPVITSPQTFSFWVRTSAVTNSNYDVQVYDPVALAWVSLKIPINQTNIGVTAATVPAVPLTTSYQNFSLTFGNPPAPGYTNSSLQFRIVDNSRTAFTGTLLFDDFSWTSNTLSNDNYLPLRGNPTSCSQTALAAGTVLTLTDHGGTSDNYAHNQDNTATFTAANAGDRIEVTFNSFRSILNEDYIFVHDAATASGNNLLTGNASGYSGLTTPATVYTSTGTSMTIRFTSDNGNGSTWTTEQGYNITVRCIAGPTCFVPSTLTGTFSHDNAFLTWAAGGGATSYDVHYNTTNTTPNSGSSVNGGNFPSTSGTVTGLSASTLYYMWVRSNCGVGGNSAWVGPFSFTTLCTPQTVTYIENFNGLTLGNIPTCTQRSTTNWQSNSVNGNLFCNQVGQSFYTQGVTLTAGQPYRISYDFASTGSFGSVSMNVFIGNPTNNTAPNVSNINQSIAYNTNGSAIFNSNILNFTPLTTGTYYLRFYLDVLGPGALSLILDNVKIETENCLPPTFAASSPVPPAVSGAPFVTTITNFGATLSWNAPSTGAPSNGYFYFVSTSSTPPGYNDSPTGSAASNSLVLSTLSPFTRYFVWVRANCGSQISSWSPTYATFITTGTVSAIIKISDSSSPFAINCGNNYTFTDSDVNATTIGNYIDNEDFTYTFVPDAAGIAAGAKLMVVFNTFNTENNWDGLMIYSGTNTSGTLMSSGRAAGFAASCPAGAYSGTISPGSILSTASDGSLTFRFRSDTTVNRSGWTASIVCVTNVPTISGFNIPDNSCGTINTVIITGTNFTAATGVTFNGVPASFVVNSPTQITAILGAGTTTGLVRVIRGFATGVSPTSFVINSPPPPASGATLCTGGTGTLNSPNPCDISGLTTFNGNLTASSPTAPKPSSSGVTCGFTAGSFYYTATQITVSVTGNYILQTTSPGNVDLMAYITSGPFVAGNCSGGVYIRGDDDGAGNLQPLLNVNLTAGVIYTLFTTTFNPFITTPYTWNITPPIGGSVSLYQASQVSWYTTAVGGTPIFTGINFDPVGVAGSPVLNNTTPGTWTFYAACSSNPSCRTAVTFTINPRPTVTFTAQPGATACTFNDVTYTTQAGQSNYVWTATGVLGVDYSIVSGGLGTSNNTVTLQWLTTGVKTVTINYNNASGCSATSATSSTATTVAASGISTTVTPNAASICANSPQILTATSGSANFFTWSTTTGALFTNAACTVPYVALSNSATVYFKGIANATVTVLGTVGGTGCAAPASATITINKAIWNGSTWSNLGVGPSNTISAEFQGSFTSSIHASGTLGNLSACSVVVTSGTVLFDRGTFTVPNSVAVNGGSLTFDDANFDVSLFQPNDIANSVGVYSGGNTGNITFRRTSSPMYKFDYTYWSSPVYPQNLLAVSPGSPANLFLDYGTAWNYILSPGTTTMTPGKGYAIRAPLTHPVFPAGPTSYQAPFTGLPNNGDLSIPIVIAGGATQMNFLGNPYPSALSGSAFISDTNNTGLGSLYFWTHNTPINASYQYTQNDYAIFNLSGGTIAAPSTPGGAGIQVAPTGNIASGQGFFVKGSNVSANAVFGNYMRLPGSNNQFFRMSNQSLERHRYWLDIANTQGAFKQLLVAYVENATLGNDILYDAEAAEAGNVISLYTKVQGLKMSIEGRPIPFAVSDLVPLAYKSTIASTYTISMPLYDGLFESQHVYLEDKLLNVIHDLTLAPYSFATEIGTFEDRFVLRYTTETLGITPVFNENSVIVYKNEQGLFINTGKELMQSVTIYDIRGRVIASQKQLNNTETTFTTLPTTQQVLLVKIEGESGISVTKKVVY